MFGYRILKSLVVYLVVLFPFLVEAQNGSQITDEQILLLEECKALFAKSNGANQEQLSEVVAISDEILLLNNDVNSKINDSITAEGLYYSSISKMRLNDVSGSYETIELAVTLISDNYPDYDLWSTKHYSHYAFLIDLTQGRFDESIIIREKIKSIWDKVNRKEFLENQDLIILNLVRLTDVFDRIGQIEKAKELIGLLQNALSDSGLSQKNKNLIRRFLVNVYFYGGETRKAKTSVIRLISDLKSNERGDLYLQEVASAQDLYARILSEEGRYLEAIREFKKAAQNFYDFYGFRSFEHRNIDEYQAYCHLELNEFSEAVKLLSNMINEIESDGVQEVDYVVLNDYYNSVANVYLSEYSYTDEKVALERAIKYDRRSREFFDKHKRLNRKVSELQSVVNFREPSSTSSIEILHAAYQATDSIHYLVEALQVLDATRSIRLRSELRRQYIASQDSEMEELLAQDQAISTAIFEMEQGLTAELPAEEYQALEEEILNLRQEQRTNQGKLFEDYPEYRRLLWDDIEIELPRLLEQLEQHNQTLIYTYCAEEHLYLLALNANGSRFEQVEVTTSELQEQVNTLREYLYRSPIEPQLSDLEAIAQLSHELYQQLLAPVANIATDRLLIIPDGPLASLPYALLLTEPVEAIELSYQDWPFLIQRYSLSYGHALDLLLNRVEIGGNTRNAILAFAPDFEASYIRGETVRSAGALTNNAAEVNYLSEHFSCQKFIGPEANLERFQEMADRYAVIHLATHAVANTEEGEYGYLAFSDAADGTEQRLQVGDLYGMQIPAQMVVLSACETGLGEWQGGEGVVGLERAFAMAGSQSLLSTHWKVSDRASAGLMRYFYDQLATGLPKDKALQMAQLQFLQTGEGWRGHPYFWAGYVQKGSVDPLKLSGPGGSWKRIVLFGGIALLLLGFLFTRRRR